MSDPSFNLHQLQFRPNWYQFLDQVDAAMADSARMVRARIEAGWTGDEGGWYSPDGISESDWEHVYGYPFPEEPDYSTFIATYTPTQQ